MSVTECFRKNWNVFFVVFVSQSRILISTLAIVFFTNVINIFLFKKNVNSNK